jgi:hypothetical protein
MDGLSIFVTIIFMLIIVVIGIIKSETLFRLLLVFMLLTFVAYMTLYLFNPDS